MKDWKMKTIQRTRIELFIPFISRVDYKETINDLIEIAGVFFKGCTIIEKVDGYYRPEKTVDITPDIINILIVDVKYTIEKELEDIEKLIESLSGYVNRRFNEDVIYYSYYSINAPDF